MHVISRVIKVEKPFTNKLIEKFNHDSPVFNFDGFIKREILLDSNNKDFDVVNISTYFKDKEAHVAWQKSPQHIEMHKNKTHSHHEKPEGVLSVEAHFYEVALLQPFKEK